VALVSPGIAAAAFDRTHASLDRLLHRHVENGRVDYPALVEEAPADAARGAFLLSGTTHLGYLAYDWTLNDRRQ
jgi:hypothetical protein